MNISLDQNTANNALLYVANKIANLSGHVDKYKLLKLVYFAEKKHLAKYGRLITGDDFIAMEHGPVPSYCLNVTKVGTQFDVFDVLSPTTLVPKKMPDLDELSESDIECLEESINENSKLNFNQLKNKSHDEAYNNTGMNQSINVNSLAKASGADQNLISYIELYYSHKQQ